MIVSLSWALASFNILILWCAFVLIYDMRLRLGMSDWRMRRHSVRYAVSIVSVLLVNLFGAAFVWALPNLLYELF